MTLWAGEINCVMESLTTEKLAKSRCVPVRILFINQSCVIILTVCGSNKERAKSGSNLVPSVFVAPHISDHVMLLQIIVSSKLNHINSRV